MPRSFLLPTALPLAVALTFGCSDTSTDDSDTTNDSDTSNEPGATDGTDTTTNETLAGDWQGKTWTNYGTVIDFPYGNEGYAIWNWDLYVRPTEVAGTITVTAAGERDFEPYTNSATFSQIRGNQWSMALDASRAGYRDILDFNCTVAGDAMDCIGGVESLSAMSFDR